MQLRVWIAGGVVLLTLVALLVLLLDSDDEPNRAQSTATPPGEPAYRSVQVKPGGPALTGNRREARKSLQTTRTVYDGFAEAVREGVAATDVGGVDTLNKAEANPALANVCALLSERAKRESIVYASRAAGLSNVRWSCQKAIGLLLRRARQTGGLKRALNVEVIGVNAKGDRATVTLRTGAKAPLTSLPLVREGGRWKLGSAPAGSG